MTLSAQKPCSSGKKPSTKEGLLFIIGSKRPCPGFAMESDTSFMIYAPVNTASRDPGERYFPFQCCCQQIACLRRDSGRKATHASAHKMQMNGRESEITTARQESTRFVSMVTRRIKAQATKSGGLGSDYPRTHKVGGGNR